MQELQKNQLRHRSKFSQLILLNHQAHIVSSCDSIFDTRPVRKEPVTDWFPFLESIYPNIWQLVKDQSNITFNKVQTLIPQLPGFYDFSFSKVTIGGEDLLLWSIYDYTDLYEDYKQFQQRRNELEIHRETLERRYKILTSKEDIQIQQNIILENLDHLQLTYFNQIKSALLAPVNALDGITFLLAGALENKDRKYTQQLRIALKQLNFILDDLENVTGNESTDFTQQGFNLISLCTEIENLIRQKSNSPSLTFSIDENIPEILTGNALYLKQIFIGILGNAIGLHPDSSFKILIKQIKSNREKATLNFQIIEYLNAKTVFLSKVDSTNMIYQLSIIKQLIDLQKGNIYVDKNPKDLSISISFDLEYNY